MGETQIRHSDYSGIAAWVPFAFFAGLSGLLILSSVVFWLLEWDLPRDLALNLGVAVGAVVMVEFLWRHMGGHPIARLINNLRLATALMSDVDTTGIARIGLSRRYGDKQPDWDEWHSLIPQAHSIDMMALTLASDWFNRPAFRTNLETAIRENNCQVRMITLPPDRDNELTSLRIDEESHRHRDVPALRMLESIKQTHSHIKRLKSDLADAGLLDNLQLKVARRSAIYCCLIRIDNHMLVAPYLTSLSGGNAPWFQIGNPGAPFFGIFSAEFENMWNDKSEPADLSAVP